MRKPRRYYCLDKPPMPGTVPRGMSDMVDFQEVRYVEDIGREACGYVEYFRKLSVDEVQRFKLAAVERKHECNGDYCEI